MDSKTSQQLTFDETGFTFGDTRVEWTLQVTTGEIDQNYHPIVQLFILLNEAQNRWNVIMERKLSWMTPAAAREGLLMASTPQDLFHINNSVMFTQAMQHELSRIAIALKEGDKDVEAKKDTVPARLYQQVTVNPEIMHFLCVLTAEQITYAFAIIEFQQKMFPLFRPKITELEDEHVDSHTWLIENPFKPLPKIHFDRKTGQFCK